MSEDIAPGMLAKITARFRRLVADDKELARIAQAIEAGTATHAETQVYAVIIGSHASRALLEFITPDALPDERLYFNIADRVVRSILEESRGLVNQTAADVQTLIYRAAGINLNPVAPVPNKWRLDDLINKLAGAEKFEDVAWALDAPVKNMAQSFADDYIRENVTFQVRAGLQPTVTRTAAAGCCEWCAAMAGVYEFDDAFNEGIYRRHERCRCVVTATVRRGDGWGRQNVWTKKWMDPDEAANIERRKTVGLE